MYEVKVFVVSGFEKIVAKLKSDNGNVIEVEDPFILKEMMTQQGPQAIILPFQYAKRNQTLKLVKTSLIFEPFDPEENLYAAYIENVSGLDLSSVKGNQSKLII